MFDVLYMLFPWRVCKYRTLCDKEFLLCGSYPCTPMTLRLLFDLIIEYLLSMRDEVYLIVLVERFYICQSRKGTCQPARCNMPSRSAPASHFKLSSVSWLFSVPGV